MDKKIFGTLVALVLVVSSAYAQKEYASLGVIEFGGTASYSSRSTEYKYKGEKGWDTTISALTLAPQVGYFVADNFSLNAVISLEQSTTENKPVGWPSSKSTESSTKLYLAPTYVFKTEGVYPFAGLLIGIFNHSSGNGTTTTTSLTDYGLNAGVKVKVIEGGLLNIGLSYILGSGKVKNGTEYDLTRNNLSLNVGFTLYR